MPAEGPRPHAPTLSPLSAAAGKFVPESNLRALQLRHGGGVGAGGGPRWRGWRARPPTSCRKASTCSPGRSHAEEQNRHPGGSSPPPSGLGCSDLRDWCRWTHTYRVVAAQPRLGQEITTPRTTAGGVIQASQVTGPGPEGETREWVQRPRPTVPPAPRPPRSVSAGERQPGLRNAALAWTPVGAGGWLCWQEATEERCQAEQAAE